jgi:hypothetical protein
MTILQGDPDKSGNSAPYLPDATGLSNADAAEEYAKAGCHILPTRPDDIKIPAVSPGRAGHKRRPTISKPYVPGGDGGRKPESLYIPGQVVFSLST